MSIRIPYQDSNGIGREVAQYVDAVLDARERGRRLKAKLDSMVNGEASPYPSLEAEIGGMTAGQGDDLWAVISNAQAAVDVPAVSELSRLDKGS